MLYYKNMDDNTAQGSNTTSATPVGGQQDPQDLGQQGQQGGSFSTPSFGGGRFGGFPRPGAGFQETGTEDEMEEVKAEKATQEEAPSDEVAEVAQAPEVPVTPEKLPPESKPQTEAVKQVETIVVDDSSTAGKIIDKRSRGEPQITHRVAPDADLTTKQADLKEQDFIAGVGEVHPVGEVHSIV